MVTPYSKMTEDEKHVFNLKNACHAAHCGGFASSPKSGDYLDAKEERALDRFRSALAKLAWFEAREPYMRSACCVGHKDAWGNDTGVAELEKWEAENPKP